MDKNKSFALPKPVRPTTKRTTVTEVPTTSKKVIPREKFCSRKSIAPNKITARANTTILSDKSIWKPEASSDLDAADAEIAYGKFLRNMLEECLVEEKIKREETQMDVQMAQLADRFKKTMDQLDRTNRRLKDIKFVVEQKRLLDLKNQDCSNFYNLTENSTLEEKINNLTSSEEACLDHLETINVDFGFNHESGHKQLLDAVNEAIEGLEGIKKNSKLDTAKFHEYESLHKNLEEIEKDRFNIDMLKSEFEVKFPKFSEKLLKDVSDKMALLMEDEVDDN
ncbi:jg25234 [Pararge aegeria aegeria]|uniref:Jg25234 protein n=2 Tax=Pararge aegeria TaxID=116150 RepID=A0A8S4SBT0_9NEOP|nr:jg25234 [Pararge aegeria aegeria]